MLKKLLIALFYSFLLSGLGGRVFAQQSPSFDSIFYYLQKSKVADGVDTTAFYKAFSNTNGLLVTNEQFKLLNDEALKFEGIQNDDYYFVIKTLAFLSFLKPVNYFSEIDFGKKLIDELGDAKSVFKQNCYQEILANLRLPYRNSNKLFEGFDYFTNKLTAALAKNDSTTITICYYVLGGFNFTVGLNEKAIYNCKKSLAYLNDKQFVSKPFFNALYLGKQAYINHTGVLGFYYMITGDYRQSLKYSYSALDTIQKYYKIVGNLRNVSFINQNIAIAKLGLNETNGVKTIIDSAIVAAKRANASDQMAQTKQLLGLYFSKLNQNDSAEYYFEECIRYMTEKKLASNGTSGILTPEYYLSLIRIKQKRFNDVIELLNDELPAINNLRLERLRDLELLADVYEKSGDHTKSVETFKKYIELQKQLQSDEQKYRTMSYETESKISASEKSLNEMATQKQLATKSRNYLIGIAALILIIAVGFWNRYRSKNKDNKKLQNALSELEIEASLERVRSVALSMKEPGDLLNISKAMFTELQTLGFSYLRNGLIATFNKEESYMRDYDYSDYAGGSSTRIPYNTNPIIDKFRKEIEVAPDAFVEFSISQTELNEWKEYRRSNGEIDDARLENASNLYYYFYSIGIAAIGISTFSSITEENLKLLKRFRNVFDLAYRRYIDIELAESQSREAQIELALERVRARTMSMQRSDELLAAAHILFEQFINLGEAPDQITIGIMNEEERVIEFWLTEIGSGNTGGLIKITIDEPTVMHKIYKAWKQQIHSIVLDLSGQELIDYIHFRSKISRVEPAPEQLQGHRFIHAAFFTKGLITISTNEARTQQTVNLLERFAGVFDLTYTRFLDLKNAEAQMHEAKIETALERVRSRTLAMQKSDELAETAAVLFKQLILLGIEPNRLYITIIHDGVHQAEFWITDEDGSKVSSAFFADLDATPTFVKMFEGWQQQKKSIIIDMHGEELQHYFEYLSSINVPFKGGLSQTRRVQHIAYFSKGFIGMASPDPQPEETMLLLERFAYVFNLTFTRFNDLKIAEAHALQAEEDLIKLQAEKKRAEDALTELKSTQQQLVQQEKLASLGALTAGIAHEIKNPLNFVNNFSELSNELVDEFIATNDEEERKEIANDLKLNLKKINEHGKRADSIVKNMLQHSRSGSGEKQLTNINQLCEEYFNIAFHGKRANDQAFNCEMIKQLDSNLPEVNCVTQDISRVILNLINNAFDAVASPPTPLQRRGEETADLAQTKKPNVTLSTAVALSPSGRVGEGSVTISIRDNGNGIPSDKKEKIFEPFYTTKPAGQGTGLGLSLSNDIIKAHGGELKVESKEGVGSEFIVQLPI